ncbi:nucleoside 2-deoxyribosyltransferase [Stappia taiwanensis]|uniref:Nucleoside 2-deoxyribosyltransferase n=1 Tax=Stappia taiwanensis TaxID=992267 RepID=A0A838XNX5_9HYPH|nr:nucleoside 2-deoxyribosyltransferase [Stappia taiwanensis]MBA4610751.1 nucleoside 2-deoxyribosyltransferase [Stappia taiwanensis]GGE82400.1 sugar kinase [Stappia taiwanensis]
MNPRQDLLLVGEVYVDFTLPKAAAESKLRLGGIVHAARGLWAIDANFSVAAVCPGYLVDQARTYLERLGCSEFIWLAEVKGAPNVMAIGDPTELADQAYQDILRDEKSVEYRGEVEALKTFKTCLIFPGKYDLTVLRSLLAEDVQASFDIAYDLPDLQSLSSFKGNTAAVVTSTSSPMFLEKASEDMSSLLADLRDLSPQAILLKENRGGSRVFDLRGDQFDEIPALLGETVNSVGVGDVYSAVFVSMLDGAVFDAGWRAARAATCYSQTTYPDDFKRDVQRSLALSVEQMRGLGGTFLPWHARPDFQIYFAAPDFSYVDRTHLEEALRALTYHNFRVRRPVQENGELTPQSSMHEMRAAYLGDLGLLEECDLVFALPLERDPGTLVEIGLALALKKPVITFDPLKENTNTMVMAGSAVYSDKLDSCLNGLFEVISRLRATRS